MCQAQRPISIAARKVQVVCPTAVSERRGLSAASARLEIDPVAELGKKFPVYGFLGDRT